MLFVSAQLNRVRVLLAMIVVLGVRATRAIPAGETLYNGIQLPDNWPPDVPHLGSDPMPVPYLDSPPRGDSD